MNFKKNITFVAALTVILIFLASHSTANTPSATHSAVAHNNHNEEASKHPVKKVLFIGDSMTGWLSERLNAYGEKNDFEVATIVWDGSTISKWGKSRIKDIISKENPDAIFVSLGMNELFERNPQARLEIPANELLEAFGDRPFVWVGPPSWPGKSGGKVLNEWLKNKLGEGNYYDSSNLSLPRQGKQNPHPTREGMVKWMDEVVEWLPANNNTVHFKSLNKPAGSTMTRGKNFTYKKMKETL